MYTCKFIIPVVLYANLSSRSVQLRIAYKLLAMQQPRESVPVRSRHLANVITFTLCPQKHVTTFLPARRYASAGYRDRNVSVRLSVCPSRAGIVSKRRKLAS